MQCRLLSLLTFATVSFALGSASPTLAADLPLNLLFFGNSFSQQDDVPGKVAKFAEADGKAKPLVVADLEGGTNLAYHIGQVTNFPANNVAHPSITAKAWDYVVEQGFSTEPTVSLGDPAAFRANAVTLFQKIKSHSPSVKAVLYETWARQPGHQYYPGSYSSATAMQNELRNNYVLAAQDINAAEVSASTRIAPVGDAFESRGFHASLYDSDKYHASTAGSLLASMVLYRTIYNENVSDISWASASSWAGTDQATWTSLTATADAMPVPEPSFVGLAAVFATGLLSRRAGASRRRLTCR